MSYSQPNYAKKKGGSGLGLSPAAFTALVVDTVKTNLTVPYYEVMTGAGGELVLSTAGDLMVGYNGTLPIVDI